MTTSSRLCAETSIRRSLMAGLALVTVLAGGAYAIGATAQISGAVIAQGTFVVDSYVKKVQHQTGGTIGALDVHDGDRVTAGQVLARLDDTQTRANLDIVLKRLDQFAAARTRLEAEREGVEILSFPSALTDRLADPEVAALIAGEKRLFALRLTARKGQKDQLEERIGQLRQEAEGLTVQKAAKEAEMAIAARELEGLRTLWAKKLVSLQRITEMERDAVKLKGDLGQLVAGFAQNQGKISELRLQIIQVDQDARSEVAKELRDIETQASEFAERKVSAQDQLTRMDIRAPQDGIVHELAVHTIGGVVAPGEQIMQIVPVSDTLRVEARIAPQDIDQLTIGQTATMRLSAFNQRVTPELNGTVEEIAPDLSQDPKTGASFYSVRLKLSAKEFSRLGELKVVPGMPAETFIQTSSRTMLSYLVKPLADQIERAFRED